jgi:hypothetical protein
MAYLRPVVFALLSLTLTTEPGIARNQNHTKTHDGIQRVLVLDGSNVHNAGRILLHVTNWGEFGSMPGSGLPYAFAPSFEWPNQSGIEYLGTAGLWVGALKSGVPAVSTAVFERELRPTPDPIDIIYRASEGAPGGNRVPHPNPNDDGDSETNEDWLNGRDDDSDGLIDEDYAAISDQMFSCWYTDNQPAAIAIYPEHNPLDIEVRQESYVWDEPRFDDIVGIKFTIKNIGTTALDDVYIGMFVDADIGNRNNPNYWEDDVAASVQFPLTCTNLGPVAPRVAYMHDNDGAGGEVFVGHPTDPTGQLAPADVGYTTFANFSGSQSFEEGGDPTNDFERYELMSSRTIERDADVPRDYRILISTGPFAQLAPNEEIVVHVAFAIGSGFNGMRFNSFNAVHAFRGQWFDVDGDPLSGIAGRETRIDGPAQNVVVDACANPPVIVPYVPHGSAVWINADCATEEMYQSTCGFLDSALTMTGVGGRETQENWYVEQEQVPVLIQRFQALAADDHIRLLWDVLADEPIEGFRVYRKDVGTSMRMISDGVLPVGVNTFEDRDVVAPTEYTYVLAVVLPDGLEMHSAPQSAQLGLPRLELVQNYPNPFNPATTIRFSIGQASHVTLAIYDIEGRLVATIVDRQMGPGTYAEEWNGRDNHGTPVASGVYLYRLTAGKRTLIRKAVLLK